MGITYYFFYFLAKNFYFILLLMGLGLMNVIISCTYFDCFCKDKVNCTNTSFFPKYSIITFIIIALINCFVYTLPDNLIGLLVAVVIYMVVKILLGSISGSVDNVIIHYRDLIKYR